MARQQRAQDKFARRLQKKKEQEQKDIPAEGGPAEDPDIAGIRPGPQPPLDDLLNDKT